MLTAKEANKLAQGALIKIENVESKQRIARIKEEQEIVVDQIAMACELGEFSLLLNLDKDLSVAFTYGYIQYPIDLIRYIESKPLLYRYERFEDVSIKIKWDKESLGL